MLSSEYKIKNSYRIEEIKKKGKLIQGRLFAVAYLPSDEPRPRFSFVVSTKVSKLAVHRNRIVRAFNSGVRYNLGIIPPKFDYVFLAKKILEKTPTEEIIREVELFFKENKFD